MSEQNGRKDDAGKLRWELMPWHQLEDVVKVLQFGASKYGDYNWMKVEHAKARYFAAAIRHLMAWWHNETKDEESGLPHLAHAACCLLFMAWFNDTDQKA